MIKFFYSFFLFFFMLLVFGFLLLVASLLDLRFREVPDFLCFSFIVGVLGFKFFNGFSFWLFFALFFSVVFGFLLFRFKQWGGADSFMLVGLSVLFSDELFWFLLVFLVVASVYGLVASFLVVVFRFNRFVELVESRFVERRLFFFVSGVLFFSGLLVWGFVGFLLVSFGLLVLLLVLSPVFKELMVVEKSFNELTVGDWVLDKIVVNGRVVFDPGKQVGINSSQLGLIKNMEGTVRVADGFAFVPAFFFTFLIMVSLPVQLLIRLLFF